MLVAARAWNRLRRVGRVPEVSARFDVDVYRRQSTHRLSPSSPLSACRWPHQVDSRKECRLNLCRSAHTFATNTKRLTAERNHCVENVFHSRDENRARERVTDNFRLLKALNGSSVNTQYPDEIFVPKADSRKLRRRCLIEAREVDARNIALKLDFRQKFDRLPADE